MCVTTAVTDDYKTQFKSQACLVCGWFISLEDRKEENKSNPKAGSVVTFFIFILTCLYQEPLTHFQSELGIQEN